MTQSLRLLQFSSILTAVFVSALFMVAIAVPTFSDAQTPPSSPTTAVQPSAPSSPGANGSASSCGDWWSPLVKPIDCFLAPTMVAIFGGAIMGVSGMALEFAGYLFDLLINTFIVAFGATLKDLGIIDGIHTGWTVLRDLSNIVIIGMFTFIAISIIIGNHTFGEKKLVAKVLVVAVLINFSLLFAKISIDASNFFAWQIYKRMAPEGSGDSTVRGLAAGTGANISGKFLSLLNTTSLWDVTTNSIRANNESGYALSNLLGLSTFKGMAKGIFFALIASVLLLAAAGVLLYGCYLIAARGLLLVFLMLVSALAFASYLIPQLSDGEYGWKTWWKSLINASIFAPILMILLYVSLVILTPISNLTQGKTLASVLSNPSTMQRAGNDWQIIVVFIFGIGMLYASLKVANSFAGKIAGFSLASMLTGVPVIGAARLTGLVGRSTLGKWSAAKHAELAKKSDRTSVEMMATRALNWAKKSTFDATKPGLIAGGLNKLNAPKFGSDWGKGGYEGVKKRQTEDAVHAAAENTEKPSSAADRAEKAKRTEIMEKIRGELEKTRSELGKSRVEQKETAKQERQVVAREIQHAVRESATGSSQGKTPSRDETARAAAGEHARSAERQRNVQGEQASRIGKAAEAATTKAAEQTFGKSAEELEQLLHALDPAHGAPLSKLPPDVMKEINDARTAAHNAAHHAEEEFAKNVAGWGPGALFGWDKKAVDDVAGALKTHGKKERFKEVFTTLGLQEAGGDAHGESHGAAHAPPAASAASTDHPPASHPAPATHDDHGHAPPKGH